MHSDGFEELHQACLNFIEAANEAGRLIVEMYAGGVPSASDARIGTEEKPLPKTTAEMVLGYEPVNRHDRRKAAKLLREAASKQARRQSPGNPS